MKVKYFIETDTLYIQLSDHQPAQTTELNENVLLDVDQDGKVVGLTIEHAMEHSWKAGLLLRNQRGLSSSGS